MIGSSIETRALSTEVIRSWGLPFMAATGLDVDILIVVIENSAIAMGATVVPICRVIWWGYLWVDDTLFEVIASLSSLHGSGP